MSCYRLTCLLRDVLAIHIKVLTVYGVGSVAFQGHGVAALSLPPFARIRKRPRLRSGVAIRMVVFGERTGAIRSIGPAVVLITACAAIPLLLDLARGYHDYLRFAPGGFASLRLDSGEFDCAFALPSSSACVARVRCRVCALRRRTHPASAGIERVGYTPEVVLDYDPEVIEDYDVLQFELFEMVSEQADLGVRCYETLSVEALLDEKLGHVIAVPVVR